jgi:hypothetical protein
MHVSITGAVTSHSTSKVTFLKVVNAFAHAILMHVDSFLKGF